MAVLTLHPQPTEPRHKNPSTPSSSSSSHNRNKQAIKKRQYPKPKPLNNKDNNKNINNHKQAPRTNSWEHFKNLLTCKQIQSSAVHLPTPKSNGLPATPYSKLGSSCCSFRDVAVNTSRVVHRADNSPEGSALGQDATALLTRKGAGRPLATRPASCNTASSRAMHFRKLSGCYECHTVLDPTRFPIPRTTICACSQCGEVFPKIESLELHQKVRHAVSELGQEDSGRNIVEIIFKSSWMKKDSPICEIERILKVHNTQRTIQRFEDCRDAVKSRALTSTRKNPRCAADGNELLRFHCTTLTCALGARGSSSLCGAAPGCGVCTAIRHGFQGRELRGVRTTASSGTAHDSLVGCTDGRRAMLVCRVIAGRIKRPPVAGEENAPPSEEGGGAYDSVAGCAGVYSNLEELFVFNPKAILPCFVVIYKAVE